MNPIGQAEALGHTVVEDPPYVHHAHAQRWTCTACGRAVLRYDGNVYGDAVTVACVIDPGKEHPYALRDTTTTPVLEEPASWSYTRPAIRASCAHEYLFSDGNAFAILGKALRLLRDAGADKPYLDAFTAEAMSGNHDHLLATVARYIDVD